MASAKKSARGGREPTIAPPHIGPTATPSRCIPEKSGWTLSMASSDEIVVTMLCELGR